MIAWLLLFVVFPVVMGIAVVVFEAWAGFLLPESVDSDRREPGPIAVLVPAHDEAGGIADTVRSLREQLRAVDRLMVIADNCTDDTAALAREAGAEVIERQHASERGKGYALAFGIERLAERPPDILIVVDADCEVVSGALRTIARQAEVTSCPAQAVYLMDPSHRAGLKTRISVLAFLFKNLVRARGLARLGLPTQLTGTGMAFPWAVVKLVPWASGDLVEDMELGLNLAGQGHAPMLCEAALVTSPAAGSDDAGATQRTRWEHGHLNTLLKRAPGLIVRGLLSGRPSLVVMGIDLAVPPLAMLCMGWVAALLLSLLVWAITGEGESASTLLLVWGFLLGLTVVVAVIRDGAGRVRLMDLLAVPGYVLWKIPVYVKYVVARQTAWVRTERD
ncbi:glycosyltransferase family 2 protein [Mucisphaera sp.]|uniref:glycosyltransferase family 2 protein n=1 Tax=Mucisphaera sp. TaxID=2913024 RepID=UPI003D0B6409